MSDKKDIEKSIQKLAGTYLRDIVSIVVCTVDSVDFDNRECDCTPISGDADTQIPGVLLCSENNNGLVVSPKVGSTVIVAQSTRNTAFVIMYSDIDKVQFMDGTFGGMIKLLDPDDTEKGVLKKLNNIENKIDDLISAINGWVPVPNDGGAALKAALTSWLATDLTLTVRGDIENELITQGINP